MRIFFVILVVVMSVGSLHAQMVSPQEVQETLAQLEVERTALDATIREKKKMRSRVSKQMQQDIDRELQQLNARKRHVQHEQDVHQQQHDAAQSKEQS